MHRIWTVFSLLVLLVGIGSAAEAPDLGKIDRRIVKEPSYTAQPRYGLVAFGAEAQTRVWLVLDKSKLESKQYDVLYADLNGNGDLTESAEHFVGEKDGKDIRFRLPDFKDAATGATHTGFNVRVEDDGSVMVSLKWRGKFKMGGGYPEDPATGYMKFADTPATAPLQWANGDGPFRFQRWYNDKLTIGAGDDLKVFVGQQGKGTNAFWAFQEHFLPPSEWVQATLIYHDAGGQERQASNPLKERC